MHVSGVSLQALEERRGFSRTRENASEALVALERNHHAGSC